MGERDGDAAVAAAHGYDGGETIPLEFVLPLVARIAASVDQPVSVDFEGGYADAPDEITANGRTLVQAGAVGLNFEDQHVRGARPLSRRGTELADQSRTRGSGA